MYRAFPRALLLRPASLEDVPHGYPSPGQAFLALVVQILRLGCRVGRAGATLVLRCAFVLFALKTGLLT